MINMICKFYNSGRKAYTVGSYLEKTFPNDICISDDFKGDCTNICLSQSPLFYKKTKDNIKYIFNSLHFIRPMFIDNMNYKFRNITTNGYSIFKNDSRYNFFNFMPYKIDIEHNNKNVDKKVLGIYYCKYRCADELYIKFLKSIDSNYRLIIMGDNDFDLKNIDRKRFKIEYTNDRKYFFENIYYFLYAKSKIFLDPWPTTLEEAVQYNKQIVIIDDGRDFYDGIDDICSCIKFHRNSLNISHIDNSDSMINMIDHKKYYSFLIENIFMNKDISTRNSLELKDYLINYKSIFF